LIVVTGGAGFIGSNIVRHLNMEGETDILVVDDLSDGRKCLNLSDLTISDYMHKDEFLNLLQNKKLREISAVFHQGACSDTTNWDGNEMMDMNYLYSKVLLHYCLSEQIPFIYASSAAVYGLGTEFREDERLEAPKSVYAYSKSLFDHYVRLNSKHANSKVVGLRYFNVYGPGEEHKASMSSIVLQLYKQVMGSDCMQLFKGCHGFKDGMQSRDFVHVDDVCKVNLWFLKNESPNGVFNLGTGQANSFLNVAKVVGRYLDNDNIKFISFPKSLGAHYQSYTCADITKLRQVGYKEPFILIKEGIESYLDWLSSYNKASL